MTGVARIGAGIELVGRRREVAALVAALDRAAAGSPTGVLLSGDAGVGKSRLVAEAVARAGAAGFAVLTGRCLDTAEAALPYLPFTEIVGALAAEPPELVAAHGSLRHLQPGGPPRAEPESDRSLGQLRVFDAVLSVLDGLTAERPALVVLEDLHWADRSSRDLVVFLLSRLDAQRLVVLATYRSDDLHRRHPLRPVLAELVRLPAVERVELEPLGDADALALVRLLADGALTPQLLHGVARRSEGNAFFAEELVSACSDGLPHSLVEVLLGRVESLGPTTQRLLRVASVAGRRVRHDQLAAVAGLGVDELELGLREAVHHHVLVADEHAGGGYVFRHALLREAIHHDLLPGERSRLHAAFAALLADPAAPDEPGRAALLAHHALAAHDLPTALAASEGAAREADEQEAPAELLVHAERALELWPAVEDAEAVAGAPEYELTGLAAWAASATGDPERGSALGRRALELAELRADPVLTATLRLKYALRLLELDGDLRAARDAAEQAMAVFATRAPSGHLAWCHAVLARAHYRVDEFPDAVREAELAVRTAGALPDADRFAHAAAADALVTTAGCEAYSGRPQQARARLATARSLARRAGDLGAELRTYSGVGFSLLEECRFADAAAELAAGEERAAVTGLRWSMPGLDVRVAHVIARFLGGDWDAAETAADLAGAAVPASVSARLVAAGLLVAAARGRFEVVERRYAELGGHLVEGVQAAVYLGTAATEAALWQGRADDAVARSLAAQAALDAIEGYAFGGIALAALGIAAHADRVAAGADAADALRDAGRMLAHAEETALRGLPRGAEMGPEGHAWLLRARAELTRLTGPDPSAWDAVVDAFAYEPAGLGYRGAHAALRRTEARLATGHHGSDVADDLHSARRTAAALRAAPLLAAVDALAARAGVAREGAAPAPDVLTPRERSVLEQVAQGHTNRQIGAALFISEKTVSVHLSRVMAKLGAGSRTEAVGIAYARGLLAPRVSA
ncbi:helix-turn-helix transcriptional regulator [Pseudonocardia hydrocarbonoxydans]|uniref:LuxR family transcriptional regulator n=1 Tax=Pseudonocardia hydrocarbonoxydans TaxID=76726 RepID=A0A4Y3WMW0_9PSEU|nr:LuxR family transcriptional regulator [Pseudonocardia hydrocarbonoxydans]GEC20272.1 LuxR family transcriptional regulator [Pseudonocardia hydrocarbonoxydans]